VVIGRRKASIFRFRMGELETWEEMAEEEVRKQNYGGFSGYEEGKTRNRAEEIAHRHYRDTAQRLRDLDQEEPFDLLLIGGPADHVDGLTEALDASLRSKLAGTFAIDPGTMTPAAVRSQCEELSAAYDRRHEAEVVAGLLDRAGSSPLAAVGVDAVLGAINQRAVAELVVQGVSTTPGRRCSDCGWLVTGNGALCPACGEGMRAVPDLLDAMASAVRKSGGSVQNVITETPLITHEVGAVLRYAVPQVDPS
jgi:peptide chain release factor subunit 1